MSINNIRISHLKDDFERVMKYPYNSKLVKVTPLVFVNGVPEKYRVDYGVRSIVGIQEDNMPIYQEGGHIVEIEFPNDYPAGQPTCKIISRIWHPNIRCSNSSEIHYGSICINAKALGSWHTLENLILFIGEILQYKNYHAVWTPPYPYDEKAAQWVREYAEPHNMINRKKGLFVDVRSLTRRPITITEKPAIKINI